MDAKCKVYHTVTKPYQNNADIVDYKVILNAVSRTCELYNIPKLNVEFKKMEWSSYTWTPTGGLDFKIGYYNSNEHFMELFTHYFTKVCKDKNIEFKGFYPESVQLLEKIEMLDL